MGKDLAAGVPDAKLYGPDGLAISSFVDPKEGGIPASDYARWKLFVATLDPDEYPPSGQKFFADFKKEYPDEKLEPVRDLRLRGDVPDPRRDRARR